MSYDTVFIYSFLSNLPSKYYIAACKIWPSYFDLVFQTTQATGLRQEQYICICGFIKAKVKIKYIILHWELQNLSPKKKLQLVCTNKDQAKQMQLCFYALPNDCPEVFVRLPWKSTACAFAFMVYADDQNDRSANTLAFVYDISYCSYIFVSSFICYFY